MLLCSTLLGLETAFAECQRQRAKHPLSGWEVNASISDALTIDQLAAVRRNVLSASHEMTFDHHASEMR